MNIGAYYLRIDHGHYQLDCQNCTLMSYILHYLCRLDRHSVFHKLDKNSIESNPPSKGQRFSLVEAKQIRGEIKTAEMLD